MARHKPDALINFNVQVAGFLDALKVRIPDDLGLVLPYPLSVFPGAAHASVNRGGLGEKAAQVLTSLIECNERGVPALPVAYTITPIWHLGKTTRRIGPPVEMDYPALESIGMTLA